VIGAAKVGSIVQSGKLIFNCAGDTGGINNPIPQQNVADAMEADFSSAEQPSFFYHLGDVVYFFGQASEYYGQFYEPYVHYPAPIFAIPGNHDGDVANSTVPSLAAFVNNFCATQPHITPDAGEASRDAMTQPNVYWTLDAPFVTMIGLYSNVPEGGQFDQTQLAWFAKELANAPQDKALIVSLHHPPYSADATHAGSQAMVQTLDNAFQQSGRTPDLVLTGHVHNYQRFTRSINGTRDLPYIVAGAGGYWHLHTMQKQADGSPLKVPTAMSDPNVTLESYCDNQYGYLKLWAAQGAIGGEYFAIPPTSQPGSVPAKQIDAFQLDLGQHKLTQSSNVQPIGSKAKFGGIRVPGR